MDTSSLTIRQITQMLESAELIAAADKKSIAQINEQYPYFSVGRYFQAARRHMSKPFSPDMMTGMQLYMGNWLLFHQFLNQAAKGVKTYAAYSKEAIDSANTDEFATSVSTAIHQSAPLQTQTNEQPIEPAVMEGPQLVDNTGTEGEVFAEDEPVQVLDVEAQIETAHLRENQADDLSDIEVVDLNDLPQDESNGKQVKETSSSDEQDNGLNEESLIPPVYIEDYFRHEGVKVSNEIPENLKPPTAIPYFHDDNVDEDKSLIVVRGFSEWLMHLKRKQEAEQSEEEGKRALKAMWQKEKLAAALEEDEEDDEIPENVFEMAVNSISHENDLISESLAEVLEKQGKHEKAIDMYRKLSLRNPQKNAYFADKIEKILKQQKGS
jgi:tetratricopeptide (TPR) repeat protein